MMSLVRDIIFKCIVSKNAAIFAKKMWAFALLKLLTFLSAKNISTGDFRCSRRLYKSLTKDIVKLKIPYFFGHKTEFFPSKTITKV